ncbi:MAG: NADH-quinone oxidoreductase subunit D [Candidatus Sumerlaeia bacterium]
MPFDPSQRNDLNPALETEELLINMGPQHPSTHGVLRLLLRSDGELVRECTPYIGYLHRCKEKIGESLPYQQNVPYADRLDYLAAMNNELGLCLAIERMADIAVPERARLIRVIVCELNRIASHLMAFGAYGLDIGAFTPIFHAFRERETIFSIFEDLSGARLLYHYIRVGGVAADLTPEMQDRIARALDDVERAWDDYNDLLTFNDIFIKRTANLGVIPPRTAIAWGLTGPSLRGSGVRFDIRKADGYCGYGEFDFEVPVGDGRVGVVGDNWNRHWVRMLEIKESVRIVRQALERLPEGEIMGPVKRVFKPRPGDYYQRVENPRGELGFYIVSDGSTKPWRFRVRGPSFCNLSITREVVKDCLIADVVAFIGSIDIVLGEVDR